MKEAWRGWLGWLVRGAAGLGLLYFALRGLDWRQVAVALATVDWPWALAALASLGLSLALKALRWQVLLRGAVPRSSWLNLFGALLAGQAVNIVLPVRGGELSRALLVTPASASRAGILAGIGAEKVFDLVALTVLAVGWLPAVLAVGPQAEAAALQPGWAGAAAALGGALALWVLVEWGEALWRRARRLLEARLAALAPGRRWLVTPFNWVDEILIGLRPLRLPVVFLAAVGLTVLIWANMLATNLLLFNAFQLDAPLLAGMAVLVLVHIGLLPSIMPGNVGPFYFFTRIALLPFGVPAPVALSYAVLLHALVVLPPLAGGGLFLLAARWRAADSPAG
jgi:uncharacterized membrane protein YbhN (UPF0104 family)